MKEASRETRYRPGLRFGQYNIKFRQEGIMATKIVINGFGRIGRLVLAAMAERELWKRV